MARRGGRKFSEQIEDFAKKVDAKIDTAVLSVLTGVLSDLVYLSPVGDPGRWKSGSAPAGYVGGHFRANWQVTVGQPATGEIDAVDPGGTATLTAGISVLASARRGEKIYMVNRVPYARRLEYGWSKQAPAGVVRITVAKFQATLRSAVAGAR